MVKDLTITTDVLGQIVDTRLGHLPDEILVCVFFFLVCVPSHKQHGIAVNGGLDQFLEVRAVLVIEHDLGNISRENLKVFLKRALNS